MKLLLTDNIKLNEQFINLKPGTQPDEEDLVLDR